MPTLVPLLANDALNRSQQKAVLTLPFTLTAGTGVNTAAYIGPDVPQLLIEGGTGSALTTITQDAVDELLGSTDEIVVSTAFGTTAMVDNNTYAFVLNCDGQIDRVDLVEVTVNIAGTIGQSIGVGTTTALTNATFTLTQVYVSELGNIAGRITYTNISAAATAGHVVFKLHAVLK
jgi:hypothetical protein